ncbi:MAG TPA: hypothetical protein VG713_07685 [Pirellulales bacterium]|nr:hypothetical protein [Pirellulales bacterium]
MILGYGAYRHELGEAALTIGREALLSNDGSAIGWRERWSIAGRLHADEQADLTTAIESLETAYRIAGQDAVLYLPDGMTPTAHRLLNADALGGVRVVRPPSFPDGFGAEYSTFRTYSIELEAEFVDPTLMTDVVEWAETLGFSGGGPKWAYLGTLAGAPIRQQLQQFTPFKVVQQGHAVGLRGYPTPASPIWPAAWHQDQGGVTRALPKRVGSTNSHYEVSWSYQFESADTLTGDPTSRPT